MNDALTKLQGLLRELFQIGSSGDLDFGIYRIMGQKRSEVEDFIDERLPEVVDEALRSGAVSQRAERAEELRRKAEQVKESFGEYAITPQGDLQEGLDEYPLGKQYLDLRREVGEAPDQEQLKASIFNHLFTFFSRYYDGGDFLSRRRYSRRQKYAIPYNGEEVYLHWANADQYYVKTGEHFLDYSFTRNGITVRFEVVAADVEHNDVKDDNRRFVPRVRDAAYDGETKTLTVPFEWRPLSAKEQSSIGKKQADVDGWAIGQILDRFGKQPEALAVLEAEKRRNAKGEPVSYLEHHLRRYTARNTSDFFIHKDLKGFLEGELDFYLKNEVLNIDDLESWGEENAEGWFEVMRTMKKIGRAIIAFLAQIEDFQKRLFEKKKFVARTDYCLTLDRIPETARDELFARVLENDEQFDEWEDLFAISEIPDNLENGGDPRSVEWLKANPHLVLDTKFYDEDFKDRLLSSIEDLDEKTDGLLIRSENFQALNLLQERYREQVKCIYIDPPYNTGGDDDFLYKDSYQHSSWLSMMEDRLRTSRESLTKDGVMLVSIDDHEVDRLRLMMNEVFDAGNFIAELAWEKGRKNDAKLFSVGHEYMLVYARSLATLRERGVVWREPKPGAHEIWDEYIRLREKYDGDHKAIEDALREWYRRLPNRHPSKALSRYKHVDEHGPWRDRDISWPGGGGPRYEVIHPVTKQPCKVPEAGWRFANQGVMQNQIQMGLVVFREDHTSPPLRKAHLRPVAAELFEEREVLSENGEDGDAAAVGMQVMPSVIYKQSQVAVKKLRHILGAKIFSNPKDYEVLARLIHYCMSLSSRDTVLDFFAGSGTTGHAVINLNREDGGSRKYILVEMGDYFDTVLKPRILKVIYSKDWREGKPRSRDTGVSHMLKYVTLEQYEDTLNNIAFTNCTEGQSAMDLYGDEYLLRYALDFETRDSETLLNVEKMRSPFRYKLTLRNGEETRQMPVDLPETFAYLLGMRVKVRKTYHDGERRYLVYRGPTREREDVAVIWRDTEGWSKEDLERDKAFVEEQGMADGAQDVFVNGDSLIPDARPLEAVFKRLMLSGSVAG